MPHSRVHLLNFKAGNLAWNLDKTSNRSQYELREFGRLKGDGQFPTRRNKSFIASRASVV